MNKVIDLAGQTFSRWTVLSRAANSTQSEARWLCRCECGTERAVNSVRLRYGLSRSCGCLKSELTTERSTKHGHAPSTGVSPTYNSWAGMVARCTDPAHRSFLDYGAVGITVCERWKTFALFLADMGEKPKGKSLDRFPNQTGNYELGNCRWATPHQQARNKSNNRMITFRKETLCLQEWAERLRITQDSLRERLEKWPLEKALTARKTELNEVNVQHTLTYQGQTRSLAEWARVCGLKESTVYYRFHHGWSVERILLTP